MFSERNAQEPRRDHAGGNPTHHEGRRRSARHGREKGLRVFLPATALELAGIDPNGPPPAYSVQVIREEPGRKRRSLVVRFYPD